MKYMQGPCLLTPHPPEHPVIYSPDLFHYAPYITRYTMSPLKKKDVCGSFIFISYWLISHAILSIN